VLAAVTICWGLALGFASGGRLRNLLEVKVAGEWAFLVLFVLQALARGSAASLLGSAALVVWGACSLVLFLLVVRQAQLNGFVLAAAGIATNALVVLANGGMPVVPPPGFEAAALESVSASQGFYQIADSRTLLTFLGDVVPTPLGIASMGDILLAIGVCIFLVSAMMSCPSASPALHPRGLPR